MPAMMSFLREDAVKITSLLAASIYRIRSAQHNLAANPRGGPPSPVFNLLLSVFISVHLWSDLQRPAYTGGQCYANVKDSYVVCAGLQG
jgi:hypothetical protein